MIESAAKLENLTNLLHLDLNSNRIKLLYGLEKMTLLKILILNDNQIENITSVLSNLTEIEKIVLTKNQIKQVIVLRNFNFLYYLVQEYSNSINLYHK
jgi:Leucine-rich repeat (LRR) protein